MNRSSLYTVVASALLTGFLGCSGCSKETDGGGGAAGGGTKSGLPAVLALAAEPAGAVAVKDVIANVKDGDRVVALGRVGEAGGEQAYFTLADASLLACTEMPMPDACKTPWDFCCTAADELATSCATVEFRENDALRNGSVIGFSGIAHLTTVVVSGTARKDAQGNVSILADGLFVRR